MLFQLGEIQKQYALIDILEQSKQNTYDKLIRSYSSTQRNKNSLKYNFQQILKQSALLLHTLRQIQQNVKHKNLLPSIFHEKDINKLLYSGATLPDWFEHVFSKEYEKQRINLETVANKVYKLHGLSQKNSQLVKQHWNMEILLKRYESLNEKQLEIVDIVQQVESFQNLYKTCKQMYKNFLEMITKKVLQFLQNTVESTMLYSNQLKKVKSFDNLRSNEGLVLNQQSSVYSPRNNRKQISNFDSRNTVKVGFSTFNHTGKMQDYYLRPEHKHKPEKINESATVQSLRQRQKSNNEFFFRQAKDKQRIGAQNSITKQIIKSTRSQNEDFYKVSTHSTSQNYLKPKQESKDSSIRSVRSYYDESIALKKYKSSTNIYAPDTSLARKYETQNQSRQTKQTRMIEKPVIKDTLSSSSRQCYHHCPHHDKPLNNHCSKHCNKLCSHQKKYFKEFGLDLTEMNKQYYEKQANSNRQAVKSARSIDYLQLKKLNSSRQRNLNNVYTSRERNVAQNKPFLRNSHDKHTDYYQSRVSPAAKQNMKFSGNKPFNNRENYSPDNRQKTDRLSQVKKVQFQSYPDQNYRHNPPAYRPSEYYFN